MNTVAAIVESPKGSGVKYKYQPDTRCFKLHKALPVGMVFPFDFGFIPNTVGEDGDPLDIIIIHEFDTFTGCVLDCRIIGGIKVNQADGKGEPYRNDRFIGVAAVSKLFANIKSTNDLPKEATRLLEAFFRNYSELSGKRFASLGLMTNEEANTLISEGKVQ